MLFALKNFFSRGGSGLPTAVPKRNHCDEGTRRSVVPAQRSSLRNRTPGAPTLSLLLTLCIIGWQSIEVSDVFGSVLNSPLWIVPHIAWAGLLFTASYLLADWARQQSARDFLANLLANAYLPLLLSIVLTALILGPVISTDPTFEYFTDSDFWNYFLNLIGWPQFTLPGVFEFNNLSQIVNEGLWSLPCIALGAVGAFLGFWFPLSLIALAIGIGAASTLGLIRVDGTIALTLAGVVAGQLGVLACRLKAPARIGFIPASLVAIGLAGAAYLGRNGTLTDPIWLEFVSIMSSIVVAFAVRVRLPFARLSLATAPYLVPALLIAFPLQQIASSSSLARAPLANLIVTFPALAISTLGIVFVTRHVGRLAWPEALVDLPRLEIPHLGASAYWTVSLRRRRELPPLLLAFLALVVGTLAVLAMTVFALRQSPWEN